MGFLTYWTEFGDMTMSNTTQTTMADLPEELQKMAILAFTEEANVENITDKITKSHFTISVAISSDGSRVAVGAIGISLGDYVNLGSVYVFLKTSTGWIQEVRLTSGKIKERDIFGNSVSISANGSTIVVGACNYDESLSDSGAAYIFLRTGTTWTQEAVLVPNDGKGGDYFGNSVAVSADGSRVVIGAMRADLGNTPNTGAVYIFSRSVRVWSQEAKLLASDRAVYDYFGRSVSITSDGSRVVIGTPDRNGGVSSSGAAYIFLRTNTTWTQEAKLLASDRAANDNFGYSVAITSDGSRVVVGAHYSDPSGTTNAGAAYIFLRTDTTWTQEAKLTAPDKKAYIFFGNSVSISSDGARVVIGADCDSPGDIIQAGAVYIFDRIGTTWSFKSKLVAIDKDVSDFFGRSVAISSDGYRVVIGALKSTYDGVDAITDRSGFIYDYDIPNCQKLLHGDDFLKDIEDKIDKKDLPFISRLIVDYLSNVHTPKPSDPAKSLIPNEAVETVRISMDINDNIVEVVQSKFGYDFVYCHGNIFIFTKNKVTLVVTAI